MKNKITCAALLLLSAFTSSVNAQWTKVGYMINGTDTVAGGNFRGYGNNMYSATDKGLFRSSNNGDLWTNITASSAGTSNEKFKSVFVAGNGDIYAGSDMKLFKSTDNGSTWARISNLPDSMYIWDITEAAGNMAIAFTKGTNYGVYYSADQGSTWTMATGLESAPRYFMRDGNTLYLGGTTKGVYISSDNGQTWALTGTGFPDLPGVWGIAKTGDNLFANSISGKGLYRSTNNGSSWQNTDTSVFKGFCQVFSMATAGNTIIASMDGVCNAGVPIKMSNDGGNTWSAFMDGISAGFYPNVGSGSSGNAFYTKKGKEVYRYTLASGIAQNQLTYPLNVFPNPSAGHLNINLPGENCQLEIINALGEIVYAQQLKNQRNISLQLQHNGLYFIRASTNQAKYSGKVIIQN